MKVQIPTYSPSSSSCIFLAYFMVTCCINAQARQPFYRYSCLVGCLSVSFTWSCALLVTMMNLYWHSLSFAHSHEYIYGNKMSSVIFAVTQQITVEYAGNNAFSEARGKWKCPWNLPTLVINDILSKDLLLHWNLEEYHCICKKNVEHLCL